MTKTEKDIREEFEREYPDLMHLPEGGMSVWLEESYMNGMVDYWLSLRQKETQEMVKRAEEIVATEMDTKEFNTNLEFIACDDLAISIIKKFHSLLSILTDEELTRSN